MASTAEALVETQSNSPIKPKDEAMVPTEDAHQDMDTAETSLKEEGNSDIGGNKNDMGDNSACMDEVDGDISIKPDSVITKEMIEEEKNLHEQSEKEEKKIKDEQDKIWQHLDEEDREQRYKRLQFLLSKSNLYTQYLLNRMSKQQEDDQKKRERQAKRKQKEKLKAEQKLKEEQEAAATAATSEATSDTAPISSDEKEAVDKPVAPVVEDKTPLRVTRGRKSVKNGNDSQDSQSSQDSTKSTSSKRGRKRKNQPSDEENEGAADIKNYFKPVGKKQKLEDGSAMSAENGGSSCDTKTSNCDKTDDNKNETASTGTINSKEENKENKDSENNTEEKINNNDVAKNTDGSNPEEVDGNSEAAKKMEEENLQDVDVNNEGSMVVQPVLFTGGKLRPYQGDGYTWLKMLYENGVNGILADEMGLGKTVQCIAMISHLVSMGVPGPFLICAPLSTLPNWCAEFRRFAPKVPIVLYHGNKDERPRLRMKMRRFHPVRKGLEVRPVVITSYEITMRDRKVMQNFEWKYLIVDEGHRIKNTECRLIRELRLYRNTHRLLLTGTPLQNNLTELWSLLNFLLPEIFDDLGSFEAWLDVEHITSEGADERIIAAEQQKNILSMLHQILTPFMLRRLKADVDLKIPPKKEILVYAPLSQLQQNFYQATVDKSILNVIEEKNYGKEEKEVDQKGRPVRRSCKKKVNYNLMVETEKDLVSPEKVKNKKKEEEELESWIQAMIDVQESSKPVRMQSATLKEVMQEKGQAPYNTKSIKVAVVSADNARTYKNEKGQEKKVLNASIADASQAVKCVIYDDTKFSKFQEGKSLIIKNIIRKPESIIITSTTKVYPTTKVEISDAIRQAAVSLLKPPQADRKPLNEALKSPVKTRVSIMGQLIQEEATQEVEVKSDRVQVKTIYIKDQTVPRCKVSLWRELTSVDVRPGDHISISDVVLNVFRGEASFSTTSLTKIQKCEAPEEERVVNIIGCSVQDVDVIFLLEDETELVVGLELVKQVFPTDEDLEYHILNLCEDGLSINATIKGNKEEKVKKSQVTVKLQNVMMQLRKCCNHPYLLEYPLTESGDYKIDEEVIKSCGKMLLLDKMLKELKVRGHKVLLFSQMTKMLDIIEDFCYLRQYKYCRLDGSCSVEDRQESMSSFNTDPELFIFLLSTRAGGLGINLTGADTVIIYDSDWNPQSDLQAQDRCHRIGQTKPVVVYRYVTANTIDQRIVERAAAKRKLEKMIIHQGKFKSGMQNFNTSLKPLSPQELLDLLKSTDYKQSMKGEDGSVVSEEDLERLLDRSDLYDIWSKTSGTEKVNPRKKKTFKSKVKKEVEGVFRVIDEEGGEKMVLKSETDTSKLLTAE